MNRQPTTLVGVPDEEMEYNEPRAEVKLPSLKRDMMVIKPDVFNGSKPEPRIWLDDYERATHAQRQLASFHLCGSAIPRTLVVYIRLGLPCVSVSMSGNAFPNTCSRDCHS